MAYVPDPTDITQPVDSVFAKTAAAEFRALKAYVQTIISGGGAGAITPGAIAAFSYPTAPPGWLLADGSLVSRTTYAALWALVSSIGSPVSEATWATHWALYSVGDGSTNFRIPDFRGVFLRGTDSGRGTSDAGRGFGSGQSDGLQEHQHVTHIQHTSAGVSDYSASSLLIAQGTVAANRAASIGTTSIQATNIIQGTITGAVVKATSTETRVLNGAINYCIKT